MVAHELWLQLAHWVQAKCFLVQMMMMMLMTIMMMLVMMTMTTLMMMIMTIARMITAKTIKIYMYMEHLRGSKQLSLYRAKNANCSN